MTRESQKEKKRKVIEDVDNGQMQNTDLPNVGLPTRSMQKFSATGTDLVYLFAILPTQGKIPASQIKKAKFDLLSFSCALWDKLAPSFGLWTSH